VIGEPAADMIRVIFGFTEECRDVVVIQRVINEIALSPWFDQTSFS
jgi:hypothetical protein